MSLKPVILIVCEGGKTEPNYFKDIKRDWQFTDMDIEIVGADICGTDPKRIVDYAKKRMLELRGTGRIVEKQNVWCVFDRDAHLTFQNAIVMANDNGFGVAFSNPCFELWYLLHFREHSAPIERAAAGSALKKEMDGYKKGMDGMFQKLQSRLPTAEKNAATLRKRHSTAGDPATTNPSTSVDKLVVHLKRIHNMPKKQQS